MTNEIKSYLEVKSLLNRSSELCSMYSLEWKFKDTCKEMLKADFSKSEIQLVFTVIMNEQYEIALQELTDEVEQAKHEAL